MSRPERSVSPSKLGSVNVSTELMKKYRTLEKALIYEFIDDHVELRDRYLRKSAELHEKVFGEPQPRISSSVFPRQKKTVSPNKLPRDRKGSCRTDEESVMTLSKSETKRRLSDSSSTRPKSSGAPQIKIVQDFSDNDSLSFSSSSDAEDFKDKKPVSNTDRSRDEKSNEDPAHQTRSETPLPKSVDSSRSSSASSIWSDEDEDKQAHRPEKRETRNESKQRPKYISEQPRMSSESRPKSGRKPMGQPTDKERSVRIKSGKHIREPKGATQTTEKSNSIGRKKISPYEQSVERPRNIPDETLRLRAVDHHLKNSDKENIKKWLELKELEEKEKEQAKKLKKRKEQQKREIEISSRANREAEASAAYAKWFQEKQKALRSIESTIAITGVKNSREIELKEKNDEIFQKWLQQKAAQKKKERQEQRKTWESLKRDEEKTADEREKAFQAWLRKKERALKLEKQRAKRQDAERSKLEGEKTESLLENIENAIEYESAIDKLEPENVGNVSRAEFERRKFEEMEKEAVKQREAASKGKNESKDESAWAKFIKEDRQQIYERPKSTGPFRTNIRTSPSIATDRSSRSGSASRAAFDRSKKLTYEEFVKLDTEKRQKVIDPDMSKEVLEKILKERKESREQSKKRVDSGLNIQRKNRSRAEQSLIDNILRQERPEPQGAETNTDSVDKTDKTEASLVENKDDSTQEKT